MKTLRILLLLLALPLGGFAQTLHVIFAADLQDKEFGMMSLQDQERISNAAETIKWGIGYKMQTTYLSPNNKNFTAEAIKKAIITLKTQPNDIIMFYYSGLGYYASDHTQAVATSRNWLTRLFNRSAASVSSRSKSFTESEFPSFRVEGYEQNPLSLDDVANLIVTKGVRFGLVMADCRSRFPAPPLRWAAPTIYTEDIRKLILRKLFLESCGVLKIASTHKGESAYVAVLKNGSAFTTAFSAAFGDMLVTTTFKTLKNISLSKLLNDTQSLVESDHIMIGGLKGYVKPEQMPHAFWKMNDCNASLRKMITPLPSYDHIPATWDLEKEFNQLIGTNTVEDRHKQIEKLNTYFDKNASINVTRRAKTDSLNRRQKTFLVSEYLQSLEVPNSKLVQVKIHPVNIKRTDDFLLITELLIGETWTEW